MNQWKRQTPTQPGWYWYIVVDSDSEVCQEPRLVQIVVGYEDENDVILDVRYEPEMNRIRSVDLYSFIRHFLKSETILWQPIEVPVVPVEGRVAA